MSPTAHKPAAIILCGGASRRMRSPKAWLKFGDETLLQRVIRLVQGATDPVVVVSAPDQSLPPLPRGILLAHDAKPNRGPLEGLLAGLMALPEQVEFVFVTSTDAPFLNPAWISRLIELVEGYDCAIPRSDGFMHPLSALYRREPTLAAVRELLRSDRLRLLELAALLKSKVVDGEMMRDIDPDLQTLRNLNTPEDYEHALRDP